MARVTTIAEAFEQTLGPAAVRPVAITSRSQADEHRRSPHDDPSCARLAQDASRCRNGTPSCASVPSTASDQPRLAAGLAGLGCRICATFTPRANAESTPSLSSTPRRQRSAKPPTPMAHSGCSAVSAAARWRSHACADRAALRGRQLVGREVAARRLEKDERAVVEHEPARRKNAAAAPKRSAAQPHSRRPLTSERGQSKPSIGRLGCSRSRALDGRAQAHPVAHRGHLAERHAGLHHAEWPRVHAEQHHALARGAVASDVGLVGRPRVLQRVVHVRDRRTKAQHRQRLRQLTGCGEQLMRDRRTHRAKVRTRPSRSGSTRSPTHGEVPNRVRGGRAGHAHGCCCRA